MTEAAPAAAGPCAPEREERRFAGTVLATATHEMNNRLATLGESVGLVADLLGAVKGAKGEAVQEALRAAARLEEQVGGLASLVRHLGGFADALRGAGPTELGRAVEEVLALTERLARQRRVRVARELAPGLPAVAADPTALRHLVHRLVTEAAERAGAEGRVLVQTLREGGRAGIRVSPGGPAGDATRRLAHATGARLEETAEGITVWLAAAG